MIEIVDGRVRWWEQVDNVSVWYHLVHYICSIVSLLIMQSFWTTHFFLLNFIIFISMLTPVNRHLIPYILQQQLNFMFSISIAIKVSGREGSLESARCWTEVCGVDWSPWDWRRRALWGADVLLLETEKWRTIRDQRRLKYTMRKTSPTLGWIYVFEHLCVA